MLPGWGEGVTTQHVVLSGIELVIFCLSLSTARIAGVLLVGYKYGPFGNEIKRATEEASIDWVLAPGVGFAMRFWKQRWGWNSDEGSFGI